MRTIPARQDLRTNRTLKSPRKVRTFSSDGYLVQLMGELDRAAISLRLAQARAEVALTQSEMAELLTAHLRSIQNYESPKKHVIPFDRLEQWAQITGRTKEWLLHGDQPRIVADDRLQALEERLDGLEAGLLRLEQILRELSNDVAKL
jgi:transcriptional regulator with XRE-family HTH domain